MLSELKPGGKAVIKEIALPSERQLHFLELGLVPGEEVRYVRTSPWGDPIIVEVVGVQFAVRASDAACIAVESQ